MEVGKLNLIEHEGNLISFHEDMENYRMQQAYRRLFHHPSYNDLTTAANLLGSLEAAHLTQMIQRIERIGR